MNNQKIADIYPLSPMQQGMLFHSLYAPETGNYHEQTTWILRGELHIDAFLQAWQQVINRHTALRTAFVWEGLDEPLQVVYQQAEIPTTCLDWCHVPAVEQESQLNEFLAADIQHGFNLAQAPLMRLALIKTAVHSHYFIWSHHHLLLDGWSQPNIYAEVFALYESLTKNQPVTLPPAEPYRNYIAWIQAQDKVEAETYWRQQLAGFYAPTLVPVQEKMVSEAGDYVLHKSRLPKSVTAKLQTIAQQNQMTLNTLVQGVWALLLSRYSGEEDVVFGATVSGRPAELPDVENLIGLFINTLPVRVQVEPEKQCIEWLLTLHKSQLVQRRFEYTSLVDIQGWSEVPRDVALFESLFVFESYPMAETVQQIEAHGSIQIEERRSFTRTNFPLTFAVSPGKELGLVVGYDNGRFSPATINRLANHLHTLLTAVAADPQQSLGSLPMLTAKEEEQILYQWNATTVDFPQRCAHELFAERVETQPDAIALTFGNESLTYAELNGRSNQLAHYLRNLGVKPESIVGICLDRSLDMIVSILGVLKAGGGYLPLDPTYPAERFAFMLQDAQPIVLLTHTAIHEQQPAVREYQQGSIVCLNAEWDCISQESDENPANTSSLNNLAYMIYTSGSTGQPKGTLLEHRGLSNFAAILAQDFGVSTDTRLLQFSSISFDASVAEIFSVLLFGGRLILTSRETVLSVPDLTGLIQKEDINAAILPPTMLQHLSAADLPGLQAVMSAGEACPPEIAHKWMHGRRFFNGYGPTEATVGCAWTRIEDWMQNQQNVTIGKALNNTQIYLLNRSLKPVPIGVPAELHVGGIGLARGYHNRPELTAEKFIDNPFYDPARPDSSSRLYKTGDLVRWREDGRLEYLGRIDHQVKIRGFRVELGEIEAVLRQHEDVGETAVIAHQSLDQTQLIAYIVPAAETEPDTLALRDFLAQRLPDYMLPASFVTLDKMPLLPNNKINRKALPLLAEADLAVSNFVAPRTPEEEILAGLWAQVLGVQRVGIYDDFFALGGHSLKATQLVSRIREIFAVDLPLRQLFESPTIAGVNQLIQENNTQTLPPITHTVREGDPPVAFAQQRLWFLEQLSPGNTFYNIPTAIRLTGKLDVEALAQSIMEIGHRHEALRTVFIEEDGRPLQHILPTLELGLPVTDMRHLPMAERESAVKELVMAEAKQPFDLAQGPLIRTQLYQLADDDFIALLTMHHIVSDGWSMGILVQEIAALYNANVSGHPSPLPDLPIQYADYAIWQRQWLQGDELEAQLAYWKDQLGENPVMLNLPTDHPRPAVQTANGATETFSLPPELSQAVKVLSQENGVTLFMMLLAVYQTLLSRYTGQTDIFVGTAVANRNRAEIENLIGFFVNTLVLRTDLSGDPSFIDLLERVREVALGAYAHQDLPFEMLVEALQPNRDLSHTPLFQVMFVLDNEPVDALELTDLTLSPVPASSGSATFDLTLSFTEGENELFGALEYNTDLFEQATIRRLIGHYQTLLAGIVTDPDQPITQLPLLTAPERQQQLVAWNETAVPFPDNTCIHHLFEEWVVTQPDAPALSYQGQTLSYRQLNERANQLAHYLRQQGVQPNQLVGIATHRSLEMVIGILGTLKAGAAYLPLDPAYPRDRLAFMLQDADPAVVLTQQTLLDVLPFDQGANEGAYHLFCLDRDWQRVAHEVTVNPTPAASADNLAYVIYTSGSTGKPKGTMLRHRGLCNLSRAQRRAFHITANHSRILQFSPLSFDASVWETFMALGNGATLVLAAQETLASGHELVKLMQTERVTNVTLPPSVLAVLPAQELPRLETVIAAGEACPAELVARWRPGRAFFNAYGPTETTVCASMYQCPEDDPLPPPIGRPIDNFQLYILDAHQQPVPLGVPGELHVGGVGLAQGYLNRPEMSAAKFVPNPIADAASRTLYKTGDLVRYRPDGNIEFLGRIDHQVKVRGFRIELGEIEACLRQRDDLQELVVVAREDMPGEKRLVAYVVPAEPPGPASSELRRYLRQSLPEYMVPGVFVTLAEMPHSPSGKVERGALPAPDTARRQEQAYVAPRNETEAKLAAICAELLHLDQVGVHDSFFDLGGHSLLATQFISRIREAFQVEVPVRVLFEGPTIADLALYVDEAGAQTQAPAIVPVSRERHRMKKSTLAGKSNGAARRKEPV